MECCTYSFFSLHEYSFYVIKRKTQGIKYLKNWLKNASQNLQMMLNFVKEQQEKAQKLSYG